MRPWQHVELKEKKKNKAASKVYNLNFRQSSAENLDDKLYWQLWLFSLPTVRHAAKRAQITFVSCLASLTVVWVVST